VHQSLPRRRSPARSHSAQIYGTPFHEHKYEGTCSGKVLFCAMQSHAREGIAAWGAKAGPGMAHHSTLEQTLCFRTNGFVCIAMLWHAGA
jgi:hypothetical protein